MKKSVVVLCLTLLILLTATISSSQATNLVLDGGFEGFAGFYDTGPLWAWTLSLTSTSNSAGVYEGSVEFSGANVTEGNKAFDIGYDGNGAGNSIPQFTVKKKKHLVE